MKKHLVFGIAFSAVAALTFNPVLAAPPTAPQQQSAYVAPDSQSRLSPKACAKLIAKAKNSGKSNEIILRRKMRLEARGCVF
ncbi:MULTISPECIES: hypothetical protein [unclassified Rhizobium]|uniref:hypothetical protein n=1 Tax=unclassified Rhizobium TaxID=2613769 RepID=UPI00146E92D7|nr:MULTISPECIES: hypothetical protein [unclassified Rhizobium]MBD9444195.1 hypothetical protein [Rhizobium sp. RHZ01]MBD9449982.1 hypothetical protein [Rhizobium sp. RHZ02]